jgi:hypothetical protein
VDEGFNWVCFAPRLSRTTPSQATRGSWEQVLEHLFRAATVQVDRLCTGKDALRLGSFDFMPGY